MKQYVLVLLLIFTMTPSASEAMELVAHAVVFGDYAHAEDDAHSGQGGDEHGCTPLFHQCGCHASGVGTAAVQALALRFAQAPQVATVTPPTESLDRDSEPPPQPPPIR